MKLSKLETIFKVVTIPILIFMTIWVSNLVIYKYSNQHAKIDESTPLPYLVEQVNELIDGRYVMIANAQLQGMLLYKTALMCYVRDIDPYNPIILYGNIAYIDSIYNKLRIDYEREVTNE